MTAAVRCSEHIEKEWPGHTAVLSRSQCKNRTTDPSGKCWQHQPSEVRFAKWQERQAAKRIGEVAR